MDIVQKALFMSINAHKGQLDKGGIDYINHPIYLALLMDNPLEQVVALLHDVLEDSNLYTYNDLCIIFNSFIADTIKLLTHMKDISYFDYIQMIKNSNNEIAIKVKLADLKHNSDISRIICPTIKDNERIKKYQKAIEILSEQRYQQAKDDDVIKAINDINKKHFSLMNKLSK